MSGSTEDRLARDTALRQRIEDYLAAHASSHLTSQQVAVHFRVPEKLVTAIMAQLARHGPLPRHGRVSAQSGLLDTLGYTLTVAVDLTGRSAPSGSGDAPREVPSLDEAVRQLLDAAEAGAEYACIEITRNGAVPPEDVAVTGDKL